MGLIETLKQNKTEYKNAEIVTIAGWLEMVNNNSALLWCEKDLKLQNYFVPSELLEGVNVKNGDRVVAEVSFDDSVKIVEKLFSVNDCPAVQLVEERVDYENVQHKLPMQNLTFQDESFNNLNLKKGENIYLYGNNNNSNTITLVNMLNLCDVQNKIYVNVSLAEKNKIFI